MCLFTLAQRAASRPLRSPAGKTSDRTLLFAGMKREHMFSRERIIQFSSKSAGQFWRHKVTIHRDIDFLLLG